MPRRVGVGVGVKAYVSFPWANPGNLDSAVSDRRQGPSSGIGIRWQGQRITAVNIPMLDEHMWTAKGLETLSYGELPNHQMTGAQAGNRFWVTPR